LTSRLHALSLAPGAAFEVEPSQPSHEIWFIPALNRYTTIPTHPGDMPEGTLRAIHARSNR
jgi:predicted RNA binding protein YcfA (HicA-like mRNA interferase family)